MTNHSTGLCSFFIVYAKIPNLILDIVGNLEKVTKLETNLANNIISIHNQVTRAFESLNQKSKAQANAHRRTKSCGYFASSNIMDRVPINLSASRFEDLFHFQCYLSL